MKGLSESVKEKEGGVASVDDTRQTLKGADLDEGQTGQSNKTDKASSASKDIAERRVRGQLGISLNSRT